VKDSDGRPVAEQWLVEGGGHAWFGGDPRGSFTQTVGLDASRVMVRFFLAQAHEKIAIPPDRAL
jgi:poly(3-hydroxybutyrate) depolymerase